MKFLAVTACPSGVAHTYMSAEALEKAAKKHGIEIKVETQGSIESDHTGGSGRNGCGDPHKRYANKR